MDEDKNYKIAQEAERIVAHIEQNLEYDEEGRSYVKNEKVKPFFIKFIEILKNFFQHLLP